MRIRANLNSAKFALYGVRIIFAGPMMRPQMAQQQQQQALHAAGGNMYMGGGGMAAIGGMHQMHQRLGYPRTNNQRPPNVSVGPPDGLGNIAGRGAQQEWRHVLMQQQQGFQAQMRSQFNQQGHQGEYRGRKIEVEGTSFVVAFAVRNDRDIGHSIGVLIFSLSYSTMNQLFPAYSMCWWRTRECRYLILYLFDTT